MCARMMANAAHSNPSRNRGRLALVGWLLLSFAATTTGVFVSTDGWYAALRKPAWNPPGWLFGPVWTVLYAMMGVAAWMVWREGGWKVQGRALGLFLLQWLLNALWTPIFFGLHLPGPAFLFDRGTQSGNGHRHRPANRHRRRHRHRPRRWRVGVPVFSSSGW